MKSVYKHQYYGEIVYRESIWTGKKEIIIDGKPLTKVRKNKYEFCNESGCIHVEVKGSSAFGVNIIMNGETIPVVQAPKWYDIVLASLVFMIVAVWGNSVALCSILPVVGGALGGGISGAMAVLALGAIKNTSNVFKKLVVWFAMLVCTLLLCFLAALVIFSLVQV